MNKKKTTTAKANPPVMKLKSVSKNRIAGSHKDDIVKAAEDFKKQRRAEKKELKEAREHCKNLELYLVESKERICERDRLNSDLLNQLGATRSECVKLRTKVNLYRSVTESMQGVIDDLMEIAK